MFKKHFGKLVLSVAVISWAVANLFPLQDTPFDEYVVQQVSANQDAFDSLFTRAQAGVEQGTYPSLYVALKTIADDGKLDLSSYFPKINLADVKNRDQRNDILLKHLMFKSRSQLKLGLDLKGGIAFTLKIDESAFAEKEAYQQRQQLGKAIDIISKRVNGLGVAEPLIRARGADAVEVQLPGVSSKENPEALNSLKKPAKLSFHKVHRTLYPGDGQPAPLGYVQKELENVDPRSGEIFTTPLYVKRIPEMSGSSVAESFPNVNQYGGYQITLNFTSKGSEQFQELTRTMAEENNASMYRMLPENHPGKYAKLAIVLDDELYSAPRVTEEIGGGRALISGNFSQREAIELANVLNNPLEFELKLEEMYEVGPTLADDARQASINAALLGAGLVVLFMVGCYLFAGLIAVFTVLVNLVIILGTLSSLQSTITLPGVAALVLTIGMAVDANILIFERIREELYAGKSTLESLRAGFGRAFSTIVDANVTTLLTAMILVWLGTGPVKGFGVTLAIGIGSTLFCSLILNRLLLEYAVGSGLLKRIVPYKVLQFEEINFSRYTKAAFVSSWIIVAIGASFVGMKGEKLLSIDFKGGDELTLAYVEKVGINDINSVAESKDLGEVVPVYQSLLTGDTSKNNEILKIQTEPGKGKVVFAALAQAYPQANLELIGESSVGSSVSGTITQKALIAVGVALIGIMAYVALRFEFGYALGAVVSTIHDVLMSIGIYVLLGGQFSAPMVAAVLMIVGYSINDTIVVFDRIREELELHPTYNLKRVIHIAISKTLSRTLLTSLTTLLAATALYIFGASVINDFALFFIIGIITGTFSSIFIAAPVFYKWHKGDRKHVEARQVMPSYNWTEEA